MANVLGQRKLRDPHSELRNTATQTKKIFHQTIQRHKKMQWGEFLGGTITYGKRPDTFTPKNQDMAMAILRAFFRDPPLCVQEDAPASYNQLPWEPIVTHEVEAAVFRPQP
ncbi:hypothetical protein GQ43DRAFT_473471 [Delitschia confertaspora ATCC 74209]|uniref:Uncharacterized protein n=1 Tax=Delitschia confertaspora ATCC 74209 TaxID=1513339 RepID=A0A9P4JJW0_9PLEO|nr:hypothetical protein GQ43DRAFT_473471 [Delitschia confertaspora ATCC 74209]